MADHHVRMPDRSAANREADTAQRYAGIARAGRYLVQEVRRDEIRTAEPDVVGSDVD
jgi:hypothetical protein